VEIISFDLPKKVMESAILLGFFSVTICEKEK